MSNHGPGTGIQVAPKGVFHCESGYMRLVTEHSHKSRHSTNTLVGTRDIGVLAEQN